METLKAENLIGNLKCTYSAMISIDGLAVCAVGHKQLMFV